MDQRSEGRNFLCLVHFIMKKQNISVEIIILDVQSVDFQPFANLNPIKTLSQDVYVCEGGGVMPTRL